ncbi:Outer membrane usher protein HtrE [compost metagenome]
MTAFAGLAGAGAAAAAAPRLEPGQEPALTFNPAFLRGADGKPIDVSRFERGSQVASGHYRVDVYLNQAPAGAQDIEIRAADRPGAANVYCFRRAQLESLGLAPAALDALPDGAGRHDGCIDITALSPDVQVDFDFSGLRLDVSIPQVYLRRTARGYVAPERWDSGVTAGFIDYNASAFHTRLTGTAQTQLYAGLNAGINVGAWRLRHSGSYSHDGGAGASRYAPITTYAQRDVVRLGSQLTIGQYYTPPGLFDSVPFTGVQLASDDRMLPDSQRGFAPAIRGVAQSNARVVVRQGGNILYETSVPPGPFVIDDLYSTGYAGDLQVSVTEADGSTRAFTVPYATVPQQLRAGVSRFSAVAGRYRDDLLPDEPAFLQGTYQRGLSDRWTGYAGIIAAGQYQAVLGGVAVSTPIGALAADITYSRASGLPGAVPRQSGHSYRLSYSKLLERTRTNFVVAAYRFSGSSYLGFADYAQLSSGQPQAFARHRNRFQLNVSQPLGQGRGSFYVSGSAQDYWQPDRAGDVSYQAGYSNTFGRVNVNLAVSRSLAAASGTEMRYMLTLAMPLGRSPGAPYLNSSVSLSGAGDAAAQVGLSGTAGERSELGYSVYGAHSRSGAGPASNAGASVTYRAPAANLTGSISGGNGYQQATVGVSGSVVAHPGGVNFSQTQGETRAVVDARGADGAALLNSSGATVGRNGYGVVSGLAPYRLNEVALDPKGVSHDVDLEITAQEVAPYYGAIVMLKYPTRTGKALLLKLLDQDGGSVPVGAEVFDAAGNALTLVGQGGHVFLRTAGSGGSLTVQWGSGTDQRCVASYPAPAEVAAAGSSLPRAQARCVRPAGNAA